MVRGGRGGPSFLTCFSRSFSFPAFYCLQYRKQSYQSTTAVTSYLSAPAVTSYLSAPAVTSYQSASVYDCFCQCFDFMLFIGSVCMWAGVLFGFFLRFFSQSGFFLRFFPRGSRAVSPQILVFDF